MDTRLLTVFAEVARSGGFAAAARRLDMDPSATSRAVASLEEELGARLFQRTTRKVSLTDAGERFLEKVEPILAELAEAREDLRAAAARPAGPLTISASVAFGQVCIMPHIPEFTALYPEVDLNLHFTDRNVDLVEERVDVALRLGPAVTGDVIAAKLMTTRYRVCASPGYLKNAPALKAPGDLTGHGCLCFDLPGFVSRWMFRDRDTAGTVAGPDQEITVKARLRSTGALALRDAACAGLGPALLADWLVRDDIRAGRLIDLFPRHEVTATSFETALWLIYPSRSFVPRKTRVLIDFLKERLTAAAA